jgi:hypothetical protein
MRTSSNGLGDAGESPGVKLGGDGRATVSVKHPSDAGFASVRVRATDAEGSAIDQTIIRAYAVSE